MPITYRCYLAKLKSTTGKVRKIVRDLLKGNNNNNNSKNLKVYLFTNQSSAQWFIGALHFWTLRAIFISKFGQNMDINHQGRKLRFSEFFRV